MVLNETHKMFLQGMLERRFVVEEDALNLLNIVTDSNSSKITVSVIFRIIQMLTSSVIFHKKLIHMLYYNPVFKVFMEQHINFLFCFIQVPKTILLKPLNA